MTEFIVDNIHFENGDDMDKTLIELKNLLIGKFIKIYETDDDGNYVNINNGRRDDDIAWFDAFEYTFGTAVDSVEFCDKTLTSSSFEKPTSFELNGGFELCLSDKVIIIS